MAMWPCPGATDQLGTADRVAAHVATGEVQAVLVYGDVAYANGRGYVWDMWEGYMEPITSKVPTYVGVGNHEHCHEQPGEMIERDRGRSSGTVEQAEYCFGQDSYGECSVPLSHRWHMPRNGRGIFWYSFDLGGVHVVFISTEHDTSAGSPQHDWLQSDLLAVNRSVTPWVVMTGHRPLYFSLCAADGDCAFGANAEQRTGRILQANLEPLMDKYHVDVYLCGHVHAYQRTCPLRYGKCVEAGVGTVHVLSGNGGASLSAHGVAGAEALWDAYDQGEDPYSRAGFLDWGFVRVRADGTALSVEAMLNKDGGMHDHVTLLRSHSDGTSRQGVLPGAAAPGEMAQGQWPQGSRGGTPWSTEGSEPGEVGRVSKQSRGLFIGTMLAGCGVLGVGILIWGQRFRQVRDKYLSVDAETEDDEAGDEMGGGTMKRSSSFNIVERPSSFNMEAGGAPVAGTSASGILPRSTSAWLGLQWYMSPARRVATSRPRPTSWYLVDPKP
ncbi:hypothetical protein CYMTET_22033 [Cymbomonas tetramitiformis]|uniref:Acid phosphatase n=1 Tax=Cymbomonas tetramitiformis TaxID=36881 RepID=A0AAE0G0P2_9CHLO|nr:hypothetical protein CYMTET_22033 [Cymbomonas tetramitiformis]